MMSRMTIEQHPKRVLVIRAGQLGDTVFATAVMEALPVALGRGRPSLGGRAGMEDPTRPSHVVEQAFRERSCR